MRIGRPVLASAQIVISAYGVLGQESDRLAAVDLLHAEFLDHEVGAVLQLDDRIPKLVHVIRDRRQALEVDVGGLLLVLGQARILPLSRSIMLTSSGMLDMVRRMREPMTMSWMTGVFGFSCAHDDVENRRVGIENRC